MSNYSKRLVLPYIITERCLTYHVFACLYVTVLHDEPVPSKFSTCWPITPHASSSSIPSYNFIHFKLKYDFNVFIFYSLSVLLISLTVLVP